MGVFYRIGCDNEPIRDSLTDSQYQALMDKYYQPYHQALNDIAQTTYQHHGELMVVDCHSFPADQLAYEGDKRLKRPDICLGINDIQASSTLIDFWQTACDKHGYSFGVNQPFAGALIPSTVTGLPNILGFMIEVNRSTYLDVFAMAPRYTRMKQFLDENLSACFDQRSRLFNGA